MSTDTNSRDLASKRLRQKQAFKGMLVAYAAVNVFLWIIWAVSDDRSGFPWPAWVTLGWGIGIAISAWSTFGEKPLTEEAIQREMDRTTGTVDAGS
jgi:hypothetical protein